MLENLKLHAEQMNLEIVENNTRGHESLCHAIVDQLNTVPEKPHQYYTSDINELLATNHEVSQILLIFLSLIQKIMDKSLK